MGRNSLQFAPCPDAHAWAMLVVLRFVWISTATSKRHIDFKGDLNQSFVRMGNLLSQRFCLLALVASVFGAFWTASRFSKRLKARA